ncbi:endonuclease G [Inquilinus ginsengisoli]|uniref:Endonuclease G n=1 Tax=Inquilinus ginsengisoli TaxID=363840 RepID=A0ABU1K041_9PROT|nr:DNA/RNA non-specific endonuclease [Inquilinus ginsengisoli]MDR6294227.1 endonuclease G [Inquilinus ginsengisoli]
MARKPAPRKIDPERLKQAVREAADAYLDHPNVTSVGIGSKMAGGKPTGELCIQFTVGRKIAPQALVEEGIPPLPASITVDGVKVPTDVIERRYKPSWQLVPQTAKDPRKRRQDPLVPGISISHPKGTAGTLGCIVYDRQEGRPHILSNWHVLQGEGGKLGDDIVQPGPFDDNRVDDNQAGVLVRSHLGLAGDCAIARIEGRGIDPEILGLGVAVDRLGKPELGDRVVKSGRTTGVTWGIVTRIETTVKLFYGDAVGTKKIGGFEIGPDPDHPAAEDEISKGGDSGSAWLGFDPQGRPTGVMLGLHFGGESDAADAGEGDFALACAAESVFKKLEIEPAPSERALAVPMAAASGYDPGFLGTAVAVPVMSRAQAADAVKVGDSTTIRHTHYSLALSKARRLARWVAWNIDGGQIRLLSRSGLKFVLDPLVDAKWQTDDALYVANRLDRGHIARRQDLVWGPPEEAARANRESFYFTNIAPQHEAYNQSGLNGLWGLLENAILEEVEVEHLRISALGGPVFRDDDPVYRGVAIPRDFWKIVAYVEAGALKAKAFLLTQDDLLNRIEALGLEQFRLYQLPIAELESRTGLDFGDLKAADDRTAPARRARGRGVVAAAPVVTVIESLDDIVL